MQLWSLDVKVSDFFIVIVICYLLIAYHIASVNFCIVPSKYSENFSTFFTLIQVLFNMYKIWYLFNNRNKQDRRYSDPKARNG